MGRLIEGVWDCRYCDSKKIRGSIRVCPVCGRQRDDNVKFYIDNPRNYVDEDVAKKINRNPDWICSYCDALNSDNVHECHICGASREDSEQNYFERQAEIEARRAEKDRMIKESSGESYERVRNEQELAYKVSEQPTSNYRSYDRGSSSYKCASSYGNRQDYDNVTNIRDDGNRSHHNKSSLGNPFSNINWGGIFKVGAGVIAAIILIMCLVGLFTPKIQEVTIQDFSWERSINIEEYVTVNRSDWHLPSDGRLLYSQREIKGYEKVVDHYETKTREYTEQVIDHYETYVSGHRDLGNGYFEEITSERPVYRTETRTETYQEPVYRDEPIYATKYYYEIDVWQHAFYSTSSGNDKAPYWKEVELRNLQREGGRSETYYISVANEDGEINKYRFDFDTWNALEKGETVTIKTNLFGGAELVVNGEVVTTNTE